MEIPTQALTFSVSKPFYNLRRPQCVLIAAEDELGRILTGAKSYFFPPTITRLLGGGVDSGEALADAAARELEEELAVRLLPEALRPLVRFVVRATDEAGRQYQHETTVFHAKVGAAVIKAGDDVTDIVPLTKDGLAALGKRFAELPETLWYNGEEGMYSWADYGKLYGPVHTVVAERLAVQES